MIKVTRLNQEEYYLNPFLIETVEATPDTVITLIGGKKLIVKDRAEEIVQRMTRFYQSLHPYSLPAHLFQQTKGKEETDE